MGVCEFDGVEEVALYLQRLDQRRDHATRPRENTVNSIRSIPFFEIRICRNSRPT